MLAEHLSFKDELNAIGDERGSSKLQLSTVKVAPVNERRHSEYFDVIADSLKINTPDDFCAWAQGGLQHIFPHGMLICGIGRLQNQNANIQNLLTCNFSQDYIQNLHQAGGMGSSPVFVQWLKTRRPVLFELSKQRTHSAWLENFQRNDLRNMAAHGLSDLNGQNASYFSFSQIPGSLTPRHAYLLEMLIPHLHVALIRAFNDTQMGMRKSNKKLPGLTDRENEILQWLGAGKSNWEISQVLKISENTVKNHVQHILIKLKVNTRAQAVTKITAEH